MEKIVILGDYEYGKKTFYHELEGANMMMSVCSVIDILNLPYIGEKSKMKMKQEALDISNYTLIKGMVNIWLIAFYVNGKSLFLHVIKSEMLKQQELSLFTSVVYFKGGTYISQYESANIESAIEKWEGIPNKYGNKSERNEIRKKIETNDYIRTLANNIQLLEFCVNGYSCTINLVLTEKPGSQVLAGSPGRFH